MSSIAYVTDENMIEYHRLCGNRNINFWRLSSQKRLKYFHKGDLLFFYTKPERSRKKGFVGYAHFDSMRKMTLNEMWRRYGKANGYDSIEQLKEAIQKAARDGRVPEKMNCLYLTNVVYFVSPIYPNEVGLDIKSNLESYCYLDQDDPEMTTRLLQLAQEAGIDLWSSVQSPENEHIFEEDRLRNQAANAANKIGKPSHTKREEQKARLLVNSFLKEDGCELIRGTTSDCIMVDENRITIVLPFVCQAKNRNIRKLELFGRVALYRIYLQEVGVDPQNITFKILSIDQEAAELNRLVEEYSHA